MQKHRTPHRHLRTLALVPALAVLVALATGCSDQQPADPLQTQATEAPAMQKAEQATAPPAATPEPAAATGSAVVSSSDGESIYKKVCMSCHAAGIANAPKLGDTAAWAPRIAKGNDALFESVRDGLNVMPPRGACASCSDEDLRSAMEYMVTHGS